MATKLKGLLSRKNTPVTQAVPGKKQVKNSDAGYVFQVSPLAQLERFLLLGSEENTYYSSAKKLTLDNAKAVQALATGEQKYALDAIDRIVAISDAGRAPKNTPAVFALAVFASFGNDAVRDYALASVSAVCRIGTDLFAFVEFVNEMRGWGRGLKSAVANWYLGKTPEKLAYQLIKYKQRDGWSHRDVLRLAKPKGATGMLNQTLRYAVKGGEGEYSMLPDIIVAHEAAMSPHASKKQVIGLIEQYGLTREMIPTKYLSDPEIWDALLPRMPLGALLRNLGNLSKCGLLTPLSSAGKMVIEKLGDEESIKRARIHPLNVYKAQAQYAAGHGLKSDSVWTAVPAVVSQLEDTFYSSFKYLEPTGKGIYVALDVSGSMTWGDNLMGVPGLDPRTASAIMAMAVLRSEPNHYIAGFGHTLVKIPITPKMTLAQVVAKINALPMGATDCSLPMLDAVKQNMDVDAFVVFTDNETNTGKHPFQALKQYRAHAGHDAKLIVNAMTSTGFTIADPSDPGMLDIVGVDSAMPALIQSFVGGKGFPADEGEGE